MARPGPRSLAGLPADCDVGEPGRDAMVFRPMELHHRRPARMVWRVVDDPRTSCQDDVCSTTSGVAIRGSFSDNGSRWVPLTAPVLRGSRLTFRHADGNFWYLDQVGANAANGQTTWNGRRYPLRCFVQRKG